MVRAYPAMASCGRMCACVGGVRGGPTVGRIGEVRVVGPCGHEERSVIYYCQIHAQKPCITVT
jgi:hypothetical protein